MNVTLPLFKLCNAIKEKGFNAILSLAMSPAKANASVFNGEGAHNDSVQFKRQTEQIPYLDPVSMTLSTFANLKLDFLLTSRESLFESFADIITLGHYKLNL